MKEKSHEEWLAEAEGKKPFILARVWNRIKNLVVTQVEAKMHANELYRLSRQIDNMSLRLKFPFGSEPGVMLERIELYINNQKKALEFHQAQATQLHRRISDLMQSDTGKSEIERRLEAFNEATKEMERLAERELREAALQQPVPVGDTTGPHARNVMTQMAVQESHDDLAQRIMNFRVPPVLRNRR